MNPGVATTFHSPSRRRPGAPHVEVTRETREAGGHRLGQDERLLPAAGDSSPVNTVS